MILLGADVEEIRRFSKLYYTENKGFYSKIFTKQEIGYCLSHKDPYPHFAVRFAAKEAVFKALSGKIDLKMNDIQVENDRGGRPGIRILAKHKKTKDFLMQYNISISLSHTDSTAFAVCVASDEKSDSFGKA